MTLGGVLELMLALEREASHFGHGRWRLPADAIDAAFDKALDVYLRRAPSDGLGSITGFAIAIYRNIVRKGPPRGCLCSRRTRALPEDEPPIIHTEPPTPVRVDPRWREQIPAGLLTDAEARALDAILLSGSVGSAARSVGMTKRDLRVRLRRVAEKIRAVLPS